MLPALLRARFPRQGLAAGIALASLGGPGLVGCELLVEELPQPVEGRLDAQSPGTGGTSSAGSGGAPAGNGGVQGSGGSGAGGSPGGCPQACDCDGDTAQAESCGGPDCDDADRDVLPGQARYFEQASQAGSFDYDCSKTFERDPTQTHVVDCSLFTLTACNTTDQGFFGSIPECGKSAAWGTCKRGALSCDADPRGSQVLRCR